MMVSSFGKKMAVSLAFLLSLSLAHTASAGVVDKVIVVVNDEVVTQREFDRVFEPIKANYQARFKGDELDARVEQARKGILNQLIDSKIAISLAKKEKVKIDEEELARKIDEIKKYYPSEDEFLKTLNDKGTNLTEFEKEIREQMLAQKLVEQEVGSNIVVTPQEIRDLYDKNEAQLVAPKRALVRSIAVRKSEDSSDTAPKEKIEKLQKQISSGKDFAEVAKAESEDPYAANGGEMGYVAPGQTIQEIDSVIFKLDEGEVSEIVETQIGYHLFKVDKIEDSRKMEFHEVSDYLRQQLFMKRFQEELAKWMEEQRKDAYISYK